MVGEVAGRQCCDCNRRIRVEAAVRSFTRAHNLPETYTVRTGRRPEFGLQLYYSGTGVRSIAWVDGEHSGDIRGTTGYVMAAGCVHPSGERYELLWDAVVAPVPEYVRSLTPAPVTGKTGTANAAVVDDGGPISDHRNVNMISLLGRRRNEGADDDALREYALEVNEARFVPPLDEDELEKVIKNACRFPMPEPDPIVVLGGKIAEPEPKAPEDWRTRYMTEDAYRNVKPPEFLIDGFLVKKSIAMLAGPVAQRKSIIALNIAHALCTGEPLFGYFDVTEKPTRTVYLCPEMGAASFVKRIKQIGLGAYVGKTLFVQTMSEAPAALDDLGEELPGAVVIVDTITRFIEGDENNRRI